MSFNTSGLRSIFNASSNDLIDFSSSPRFRYARPRLTCNKSSSGVSEIACSSSGTASLYLRHRIQRRHFDLFTKRLLGVRVILLLPVNAAEQVVRVILERIDLRLLLQHRDRFGIFPLLREHVTKVASNRFMLRLFLEHTSQ